MKPLLILRPEPGLAASAERARALGLEVVCHPLFTIEPVAATLPTGRFDAVILTSANAVRHGAALLEAVRSLPAYAVGEATAAAARLAGIEPVAVGSGGVDWLDLPDGRLLHLTGEVHRPLPGEATVVVVYRAAPTANPLPPLGGMVVAVHSAAAGQRLDVLAGDDRAGAHVAAISAAVADACGAGWASAGAAPRPDDESLLALAATLCQSDHQ